MVKKHGGKRTNAGRKSISTEKVKKNRKDRDKKRKIKALKGDEKTFSFNIIKKPSVKNISTATNDMNIDSSEETNKLGDNEMEQITMEDLVHYEQIFDNLQPKDIIKESEEHTSNDSIDTELKMHHIDQQIKEEILELSKALSAINNRAKDKYNPNSYPIFSTDIMNMAIKTYQNIENDIYEINVDDWTYQKNTKKGLHRLKIIILAPNYTTKKTGIHNSNPACPKCGDDKYVKKGFAPPRLALGLSANAYIIPLRYVNKKQINSNQSYCSGFSSTTLTREELKDLRKDKRYFNVHLTHRSAVHGSLYDMLKVQSVDNFADLVKMIKKIHVQNYMENITTFYEIIKSKQQEIFNKNVNNRPKLENIFFGMKKDEKIPVCLYIPSANYLEDVQNQFFDQYYKKKF